MAYSIRHQFPPMKYTLDSITKHLAVSIADMPLLYHHVHLAQYVVIVTHGVHNQAGELVMILQQLIWCLQVL